MAQRWFFYLVCARAQFRVEFRYNSCQKVATLNVGLGTKMQEQYVPQRFYLV